MIFLTTGTYPLPFDRIVKMTEKAIELGVIKDTVIAQIGHCLYRPTKMEFYKTFPKEEFDNFMKEADVIISHAGIGSIMGALQLNKAILIVPRIKALSEHVNDHQVSTAKKFEELGHVLAAYNEEDFLIKIREVQSFKPRYRNNKVELVSARIAQFIEKLI